MSPLDRNEHHALAYVIRFRAVHGYSPSIREIAKATRRSVRYAHSMVRQLVKRRLLKKQPCKCRDLVPKRTLCASGDTVYRIVKRFKELNRTS